MYFPHKHMNIPQPKVLIPALFAVVAGIPMLLQSPMPSMIDVSANLTGAVSNVVVPGREALQELRRDFYKARDICMDARGETDRAEITCPENMYDPSVQKWLEGTMSTDAETEEEIAELDEELLDIDPSALTFQERASLRRSTRSGSCSESLKGISESFYLLCVRTLDEMGSDREEAISDAIKRTSKAKMHTAAPLIETVNERIENSESAKPEDASEIPRFRFRRDGSMTLPQDE